MTVEHAHLGLSVLGCIFLALAGWEVWKCDPSGDGYHCAAQWLLVSMVLFFLGLILVADPGRFPTSGLLPTTYIQWLWHDSPQWVVSTGRRLTSINFPAGQDCILAC